jgi:hypothetical protein
MEPLSMDSGKFMRQPAPSPVHASLPPFHLITPVWGETYTRCFVDVALPTLLAGGNLPALQEIPQSLYRIFTRESDRATITESPAFAALSRLITVKFSLIGAETQMLDNHHLIQSDCYRRGIAEADAADSNPIE